MPMHKSFPISITHTSLWIDLRGRETEVCTKMVYAGVCHGVAKGGGGLGLHIDQYERDNLNTLAMECISDASEHEGEDCLHAETTS